MEKRERIEPSSSGSSQRALFGRGGPLQNLHIAAVGRTAVEHLRRPGDAAASVACWRLVEGGPAWSSRRLGRKRFQSPSFGARASSSSTRASRRGKGESRL